MRTGGRWGRLTRTCGLAGSPLNFPQMSDGASLFRHEYGLFYYDAPSLPYAQSAAVNIAQGARQVTAAHARRGHPRAGRRRRVLGRHPQGPPESERPAGVGSRGRSIRRTDGKLDFRCTGRDLVVRIQSTRSGVQPWTFGQMLVHLAPRGRR